MWTARSMHERIKEHGRHTACSKPVLCHFITQQCEGTVVIVLWFLGSDCLARIQWVLAPLLSLYISSPKAGDQKPIPLRENSRKFLSGPMIASKFHVDHARYFFYQSKPFNRGPLHGESFKGRQHRQAFSVESHR